MLNFQPYKYSEGIKWYMHNKFGCTTMYINFPALCGHNIRQQIFTTNLHIVLNTPKIPTVPKPPPKILAEMFLPKKIL